jgi:hypothetical protein
MKSRFVVATIGCLLVACSRYEWRNELDVPGLCPLPPDTTQISVLRHSVAHGSGSVSSVRGRVVTRDSGAALTEARIVVTGLTERRSVDSDSLGLFAIDSLSPDRYRIEVRRVGSHGVTETLDLAPGDLVQVAAALAPFFNDGSCSGFAAVQVRKPWWRFW